MRADPSVLCSPPFHGGSGRPGARNSFAAKSLPQEEPAVARRSYCSGFQRRHDPLTARSARRVSERLAHRLHSARELPPFALLPRFDARPTVSSVGVRPCLNFGSSRAEAHLAPRVIRIFESAAIALRLWMSAPALWLACCVFVISKRRPVPTDIHKLVSKRILSRGTHKERRRTRVVNTRTCAAGNCRAGGAR